MPLTLHRTSKLCSDEEAARLVEDGDTFTISGDIGWMYPAKVLRAVEVRFLSEGHPRDLTWFEPFPTGVPGLETFGYPGFLKRVIGGWFTAYPKTRDQIVANAIEGYCYPLGTLGFLCQQIAAGRDGLLSEVGLGTYIDPRLGGGRLNERTREELVTLVEIDGKEHIWFRAFPIDVALIRGTTIDEAGNLSLEEEHATMSILYQAMAAKRYGGTVIAQAKTLVKEGQIPTRLVAVPGALVDAIVIDPDQHPDETHPHLDWLIPSDRVPKPPARVLAWNQPEAWRKWIHEGRIDEEQVPAVRPLTTDMAIARRAALELRPGDVINIGAGLAMRDLLPVTIEEDIDERCLISIEPGHLGGWVNGSLFRANTTSILSTPDIFSIYNSGLISKTFLSMLQFDRQGNVNLLRYGDTIVGPGGSMDIAAKTGTLIFSGTFTAGGLQTEIRDGKIRIVKEGHTARMQDCVEAICFNGQRMLAEGKRVLYLTERAAFRLTEDGPELFEVAPGIDVESDVIKPLGFRPPMAERIGTMDERIFREGPMGLGAEWERAACAR